MDNKDELSGAIMNIQCNAAKYDADPIPRLAYKEGHRDARHAAVDLVNEFAAQAEQSQPPVPRVGGVTSLEGLVRFDICPDEGESSIIGADADGRYFLAKDVERLFSASLVSQSQAAQPTTTAPLKLYAFTEDGMEIDNAFGHWYNKDDVERLFAAHIAGTSQAAHPSRKEIAQQFVDLSRTSQATKAQAEPVGVTSTMPGTAGFTMACFKASAVPVGTNLYLAAPVAKEAPAVPSAWMRSNRKECTTAESKAWMESAGFGHWPSIAKEYTIPLYEVASVAKEATRDQDEQQTNVLPPFAAPAGQHDATVLPARRFASIKGFFDADYVEFAAGCTYGGGVLDGVPHDSKHYARSDAESFVKDGAWREITVPPAAEQSNIAGSAREGGITNTESGSDIATTTSTVSAPDDRDTLAFAIVRAAERRGIINANTPLTGPQLVMLCDALAAPSSTEGAPEPIGCVVDSDNCKSTINVELPVGTQLYLRAGAQKAPEEVRDAARLDAFAKNPSWELSQDSDPEDAGWCVHKVVGPRNDREWREIGKGSTPREAIDAALRTSSTDQANADTGSAE